MHSPSSNLSLIYFSRPVPAISIREMYIEYKNKRKTPIVLADLVRATFLPLKRVERPKSRIQ